MSESIVLDIRDLKSHFFTAKGEIPAVDGVSIEVPAGKIIGIVGESGCGKSMTAMSVMGLLRHPARWLAEPSPWMDVISPIFPHGSWRRCAATRYP